MVISIGPKDVVSEICIEFPKLIKKINLLNPLTHVLLTYIFRMLVGIKFAGYVISKYKNYAEFAKNVARGLEVIKLIYN